jgi:hypothetical protein
MALSYNSVRSQCHMRSKVPNSSSGGEEVMYQQQYTRQEHYQR